MSDFNAANRVAAGAALLDASVPGWWQTFDLERFDLADGCHCVIGQVYPAPPSGWVWEVPFDIAINRGWLDLDWDLAETLGFYVGTSAGPEYRALEAEWRRVIAERRS